MTLVLNRTNDCPVAMLTTAGLNKIALRVPAHEQAQKLLAICDMPIAAPSANPSGRISPSTADHVYAGLAGKIDLILDGGPCENGLESTIIDCSGEAPVLLRPGGISRGAIETALHSAGLHCRLRDAAALSDRGQPDCPGQLQSHYAPDASVRLNATSQQGDEELIGFGPIPGAGQLSLSLSQSGNIKEAAANLFSMLHQANAVTTGTTAALPSRQFPKTALVKPLMTACNVPPHRAIDHQARQNRQQEDLQRIFFSPTIYPRSAPLGSSYQHISTHKMKAQGRRDHARNDI